MSEQTARRLQLSEPTCGNSISMAKNAKENAIETPTTIWISVQNTLETAVPTFLGYLPSLVGALVILFVGWLIARFVRAASKRILMVAADFAGAIIPVVLTRLGQDPATSSSIILTTVTDIAGFFAFLGIATLLMQFL